MLHNPSLVRLAKIRRILKRILKDKLKSQIWSDVPGNLLLRGTKYYSPWVESQLNDIIKDRFEFLYDKDKKSLSFFDKTISNTPGFACYDGGSSGKVLFILFPTRDPDSDDAANIFSLIDADDGFESKVKEFLKTFFEEYKI